MKRGTPVTFTARLGAVSRGTVHTATQFVGTIEPGQVGLYQEPIILSEEIGWHLIQFGAWDVAATIDCFEPA